MNGRLKKKCLKAFLDLTILARLSNKPMSGYEIAVEITKEFEIFINPSIIYSTIYSLQRDCLVKSKKVRKGRIFEITEEGENFLKVAEHDIPGIQILLKRLLTP